MAVGAICHIPRRLSCGWIRKGHIGNSETRLRLRCRGKSVVSAPSRAKQATSSDAAPYAGSVAGLRTTTSRSRDLPA
jgi:hypothetical protein